MWPQPRSVDVAVSARKRTNLELVTLLCHHLLHSLPKPIPGEDQVVTVRRALAEFLREAEKPVTVVVDAIDNEVPSSLVQNVLVPLAASASQLCLIVGSRSPREDDATVGAMTDRPLRDLAAGAAKTRWIQVDRSRWWNDDDIVAFIRNILINKENSPTGTHRTCSWAEVTSAITGVARFSYLIAELGGGSRWRGNLRSSRRATATGATTSTKALIGVLRNNLNTTVPDPEARRRSL